MPIDPFIASSRTAQRNGDLFVRMRAQLDDLQRQLSSGKKTDTYSALGVDRRISLDTRAKLGTVEGWNRNIEQGQTRITLLNQSVQGISKNALDGKSDARPGAFVVAANGEVPGQILARDRLAQTIDMLNVDVGGRYLFSGRSHDVKPVEKFDTILNGDGAGRAGVKALISERQQADAGVGDQGRLTSTLAGTTLTVANDSAIALDPATGRPVYGFTLAGASSSTPGITATFGVGPPATTVFNVAANPVAGSRITLALTLPDGTSESIELEARLPNVNGPAETGFNIGATPAATAANLAASVTAALQKETKTTLNAASAVVAARNFFAGSTNNEPVRVPGPGFTTATALPAAVPNSTVIWYKGDDDTAIAARNTGPVQIDNGQTVQTGSRANEAAFRETLATFAVFSTSDFTPTDPTSRDRYEAVADRVRTNLAFPTTQKPQDIAAEISTAQVAMGAASTRHRFTTNFLETARARVEDASNEEVIVSLTALQTRMEATYRTTAVLSQLTLTDYLR